MHRVTFLLSRNFRVGLIVILSLIIVLAFLAGGWSPGTGFVVYPLFLLRNSNLLFYLLILVAGLLLHYIFNNVPDYYVIIPAAGGIVCAFCFFSTVFLFDTGSVKHTQTVWDKGNTYRLIVFETGDWDWTYINYLLFKCDFTGVFCRQNFYSEITDNSWGSDIYQAALNSAVLIHHEAENWLLIRNGETVVYTLKFDD